MLAAARVLMTEPDVLVLDEPTANQSPELTERILGDDVRRLADRGTAVLLVEQKVKAALDASDWAYVLVSEAVQVAGLAAKVGWRPDLGEIFLGVRPSGVDAARRAGVDRCPMVTPLISGEPMVNE